MNEDKRLRIKLNKGTIIALHLLEERLRNDQKEIIEDCIANAGEDPKAVWEMKSEGNEVFLIKRGMEDAPKELPMTESGEFGDFSKNKLRTN
jgi:hypothetical protein